MGMHVDVTVALRSHCGVLPDADPGGAGGQVGATPASFVCWGSLNLNLPTRRSKVPQTCSPSFLSETDVDIGQGM